MHSLYDFPQAYKAVLERSDDVVVTETATIQALLAKHGLSGGRILELACGACPHGRLLAARGFHVTGIDRAPAMLAEAQQLAQASGIPLRTVSGDIVDFDLDEPPCDAAIFMFETFPLITRFEDIASHFAAVRRHLKHGGIYIVDVDVQKGGVRTQAGTWGERTVPFSSGHVDTWNEDLPGDWVDNTNRMVLHCRIHTDGDVIEARDEWIIRCYSPWGLALLARALGGWTTDGFYSWRDPAAPVAGEAHYFAVFVAD